MEPLFVRLAHAASSFVDGAAVLTVLFGALEAFVKLLWVVVTPRVTHGAAQGHLARLRHVAAPRP